MGKTAKLAPLVTLVTTESRGRAVKMALLALLVRQGHRGLLVRRALRGSQERLDQPAPLEQLAK
jgi:hypothetical protein